MIFAVSTPTIASHVMPLSRHDRKFARTIVRVLTLALAVQPAGRAASTPCGRVSGASLGRVVESVIMSAPILGRIVGETIQLDGPVLGLEGRRVRVTVEVLESDEHPAARAWKEAPIDESPVSVDEHAKAVAAKSSARWSTTAEIRAKLASRDREPTSG